MKNIVQTFIWLFTLALSITLYSCNTAADEYLTDSGSVIVEGEMASLTFGIGEDMFTDITSRSAFKCDTVVQSLGDSLMVETIISPDYGLLTRAAKAVRNGVKILVVAYSQTQGKYIKREVATVNAGKFTIHLPAQETYDLIFYAVNDPTGIDLSTDAGYFTGTWTPGGEGESSALAGEGAGLKAKNGETTRDLMWTKATVNASSNATLPSISMKHLFCCANMTVIEKNGGTITAYNATLGNNYEKADNVLIDRTQNNRPSWAGAGSKGSNLFTKNTPSDKLFIPNTANPISLSFSTIVIDGKTYTANTPQVLSQKFAPGMRYNLTATVTKHMVIRRSAYKFWDTVHGSPWVYEMLFWMQEGLYWDDYGPEWRYEHSNTIYRTGVWLKARNIQHTGTGNTAYPKPIEAWVRTHPDYVFLPAAGYCSSSTSSPASIGTIGAYNLSSKGDGSQPDVTYIQFDRNKMYVRMNSTYQENLSWTLQGIPIIK